MPSHVSQHHIYEARQGINFTQYIGTSSTPIENTLHPGDVFIDVEEYKVFYMGSNGFLIPWTSIMEAHNTRHPLLDRHYVLVPLQTRFSWLSITGIDQWRLQATDSNPYNILRVHIDRIREACTDYSINMEMEMGHDLDVDGEIDHGMYFDFIFI